MSDTDSNESYTGGCECRAVRYRVTGRLSPVIACHCGQCRRIHGHYAPYTNARTDELQIESGDSLGWYASSDFARRGFCKTCGASLFWERLGGAFTGVAAGTLDSPTGLKTVAHIFLDDKGDYYEVADDGLEKHPGSYGSNRPGGNP